MGSSRERRIKTVALIAGNLLFGLKAPLSQYDLKQIRGAVAKAWLILDEAERVDHEANLDAGETYLGDAAKEFESER